MSSPPPVAGTAERDSNAIIEGLLDERMAAIENAMGGEAITLVSELNEFVVEQVKDAVEAMKGTRKVRRPQLTFIIETPGGYVAAVERLVRILRHHYRRIDFVVPSYAMSAGTVLVMAGDAIHMNYASVLGPIDPQVEVGGRLVPALGYLEQYKRLIKKSAQGTLTTAELSYLVQRFDPGALYQYEHEAELSKALLEDWLARYKFKNWKKTQTRRLKVTPKMRKERAREIANRLSDTEHWHSHGRGIPMENLRRQKLLIDDFEKDSQLGPAVFNYYSLFKDYSLRRGHWLFTLHRRERYVGFGYPEA